MAELDHLNSVVEDLPAARGSAPDRTGQSFEIDVSAESALGAPRRAESSGNLIRAGMAFFLAIICVCVAGFLAWRVPEEARPAVNPANSAGGIRDSESRLRIFAGGIVEGTNRELSLRFEIPGKVKTVLVRQGDQVKAGDVLAELESDLSELNLAEARLRLKIAMAQHTQSIADLRQWRQEAARGRFADAEKVRDADAMLERPQNSGRPDIARLRKPQQERDRSKIQLQSLRTPIDSPEPALSREDAIILDGKVSLAEVAVRRERLLLEKHRLRTPIDGLILRSTLEPGELTGPADEANQVTLVSRDEIRVRAFVEELDALRVKAGQPASVSVAGHRDRTYQGIVRTCSPDVRPKFHRHLKPGERLDVRVREVVVELKDGSDLLIGLPAEVYIEDDDAGP